MTTFIDAINTVINPEQRSIAQTVAQTIHNVMAQPACQVTGESGGQLYAFPTEYKERSWGRVQSNASTLFASVKGIEILMQRLIEKARTTPLDAAAIVAEIEAVKKFR